MAVFSQGGSGVVETLIESLFCSDCPVPGMCIQNGLYFAGKGDGIHMDYAATPSSLLLVLYCSQSETKTGNNRVQPGLHNMYHIAYFILTCKLTCVHVAKKDYNAVRIGVSISAALKISELGWSQTEQTSLICSEVLVNILFILFNNLLVPTFAI